MAGDGKKKSNAKPDSKRQRKYNSKPAQKKARAARNKARREAIKDGRVSKGDGKDIDHKTPLTNGGSNSKKNTRVKSASANRKAGGRIGGKRSQGGGRPKGSKTKGKK
jgi:hypothetical protein